MVLTILLAATAPLLRPALHPINPALAGRTLRPGPLPLKVIIGLKKPLGLFRSLHVLQDRISAENYLSGSGQKQDKTLLGRLRPFPLQDTERGKSMCGWWRGNTERTWNLYELNLLWGYKWWPDQTAMTYWDSYLLVTCTILSLIFKVELRLLQSTGVRYHKS